jgi:multimeric flavodoxin WrbA
MESMEKVKVKIMGISCNHRKARNTAWLTLFALKAVEKFGRRISDIAEIETEFIELRGKDKKISNSAICKMVEGHYEISEEDYVTRVLMPKMAEADGFVFGSPVFTGAFTSKFIKLFEHLRAGVKEGLFTNKPAGCVAVATMPMGGQDRTLESMEICTRSVGMIPVHILCGCSGTSGIPYGPLPGDDDGTVVGVKKDRYSQWSSIQMARRVAEVAVMQKLAKRRLEKIHKREFIQKYNLPFHKESWAWVELDKEDQQFMNTLDGDGLNAQDETIVSRPKGIDDGGVTCKILGLGCDDYSTADTNWLVINSLKAIEKFGRRLEPFAGFETEFIDLTSKKVRPCLNCDHYTDMPHGGKRWKGAEYPSPDSYGCVIKKDYCAEGLLPRYAEADGVIYGSSVCALAPSITFRLFAERLVRGIWAGWNNLKPTANIAVSYDMEGGQESCLNIMNTCNRWVEALPVSWPHGTPARGGSPGSREITVKDDPMAVTLSVVNARRVAEFALMTKLAKQEIGEDLYKKEFYFVLHPPHGDASWEWSRLDKEEEEYMMNLSVDALAKLGK